MRLRSLRELRLLCGLIGCSAAGTSALTGCSSGDTPEGSVAIFGDADIWTQDPVPTRVQLEIVQGTARATLANATPPVSSVLIGRGGPSGTIASFEATGFDVDGNVQLRGATVPFLVQGFEAIRVPMFVGRTGGFSQPPDGFQRGHRHPVVGAFSHAFLFALGGDGADTDAIVPDFYDLAGWAKASNTVAFPILPTSVALQSSAALNSRALLVNDAGATWVDVYATATVATPPTGLNFAEVAGGDTLSASDETQYIVGATRKTGDPTDKVLRVSPDGTLAVFVLSSPRLGAAAGLVDDQLVVAAGSADAAGAEVLAVGATNFVDLPLLPDATQGAGLGKLSAGTAILVGGSDPVAGTPSAVRTIDLTCESNCTPSALDLPELALARTRVFPLGPNQVLVLGEADAEENRAYTIDTSGETPALLERPLRVPRNAASPALLPNGQIALVGGTDASTGAAVLSLEVFFWE